MYKALTQILAIIIIVIAVIFVFERNNRKNEKVTLALAKLEKAANSDSNLMEPILAAVREYATLGEICNILRQVFGEYRDKG